MLDVGCKLEWNELGEIVSGRRVDLSDIESLIQEVRILHRLN